MPLKFGWNSRIWSGFALAPDRDSKLVLGIAVKSERYFKIKVPVLTHETPKLLSYRSQLILAFNELKKLLYEPVAGNAFLSVG